MKQILAENPTSNKAPKPTRRDRLLGFMHTHRLSYVKLGRLLGVSAPGARHILLADEISPERLALLLALPYPWPKDILPRARPEKPGRS